MAEVTILQGDALAQLRTLPSGSVQCVVTSPPYWGLRAYNTEPQVWANGTELCAAHEWGERITSHKRGQVGARSSLEGGAQERIQEAEQGSFCVHCHAWRGELGLEPTVQLYVAHLVTIFQEVRRVLRDDGTLWLNLGDSYASGKGTCFNPGGGPKSYIQEKERFPLDRGSVATLRADGLKPKDLLGVPWRVAFALQDAGWWLRADIIWAKKAPMPESVTDRPTRSHEHVFLLTKASRYYYDAEAVKEPAQEFRHAGKMHPRSWHTPDFPIDGGEVSPIEATPQNGRNQRDVWLLGPSPFNGWRENVRQVRVERDAIDGDTKRTTSPDCPVHGDRPAPVAMLGDDVHEDALPNRNGHNDSCPAPEQQSALFATDQTPVENLLAQSWGSSRLAYVPSAIDHNSETHKTGRVLATTPPCTPCAETLDHTEHSAASPDSVDSDFRTSANSSAPDGSDDHPSIETLFRTAHKSSWSAPPECTCSFYHEVTEKSSHFATFPPEIPRRAILAGTSERGCCPACGAPWVRVVAKGAVVEHPARLNRTNDAAQFSVEDGAYGPGGSLGRMRESATTGWRPTCACNAADPQPCTILDPFGGSGTTAAVAVSLGRRAILIELNAAYIELQRARIAKVQAPLL